MWIDQRDRNSKAGWIWGSIVFHAGLAAFLITQVPAEHAPIAKANATENVTMTISEKTPEGNAAEQKEAAPAAKKSETPSSKAEIKKDEVKVVAVKKPTTKKIKHAKIEKPKKKAAPAIATLPKKEVLPEMDPAVEDRSHIKGVVIPETTSEQNVEEELAQEGQSKEEPLVATAPAAIDEVSGETTPAKATGNGKDQTTEGKGNAASPTATSGNGGTSSRPVSYLELKQKPGNAPPRYPEEARREGMQGQTQLKYFVTENGSVSNVQVVKSSGSAALDKEAVNAISRYQYYPGQQGWASHPVTFSLRGPEQTTPGRLRTAGGE